MIRSTCLEIENNFKESKKQLSPQHQTSNIQGKPWVVKEVLKENQTNRQLDGCVFFLPLGNSAHEDVNFTTYSTNTHTHLEKHMVLYYHGKRLRLATSIPVLLTSISVRTRVCVKCQAGPLGHSFL